MTSNHAPAVDDMVWFADGESMKIVEVVGKEDDGAWDCVIADSAGNEMDVYIIWSADDQRWNVEEES